MPTIAKTLSKTEEALRFIKCKCGKKINIINSLTKKCPVCKTDIYLIRNKDANTNK